MRNEMRLIPTRIGTAPTSRRTMYRSIVIASRPDPVFLQGRGDVPLDEVIRDPGRGRHDPAETVLDHRQRLGDEKEDVRLLLGQDLLDPVVRLLPFREGDGAAALVRQG